MDVRNWQKQIICTHLRIVRSAAWLREAEVLEREFIYANLRLQHHMNETNKRRRT